MSTREPPCASLPLCPGRDSDINSDVDSSASKPTGRAARALLTSKLSPVKDEEEEEEEEESKDDSEEQEVKMVSKRHISAMKNKAASTSRAHGRGRGKEERRTAMT